MAKKEESLFALAPLSQSPSFGDDRSIVPLDSTRSSHRDEQWIVDEQHKQTLIMQGFEIKTVQAMKLMAEIQKEGIVTFDEATAFIFLIKDEQRNKEHQAYIEEFCARSLQMMGRHILAITEVGATNIGMEVHRSLYPPGPIEPRGFFKRLFG